MSLASSDLYALEKELFLRALELRSPDEQRALLIEACGEHDDLRRRLERLLDLNQQKDNLLLDPTQKQVLERERASLVEKFEGEGTSFERIDSDIRVIADYELVEEIGRGAMGIVFRSEQRRLNREVALKVIGGATLASPSERQRFLREARAAAHLDHPNIVSVYEVGQHDDLDFYSMALIRGGTLGALMREKRLERRRAVKLLAVIARAMQAAHQQGIIHRDLKPDNILLDERGQPYISDFGLACRLEQRGALTLTGQIMGTPQYMAPEQADTALGPVTTAADIYGLGSILYELLAGAPAFRGDSTLQILRLVKEESPRSLRLVDPAIDRDLNTIVLKCLEKKPADRYGSAESLANDLEAWLDHRPIAARAPDLGERMVKWIRRRPVHAALFVSVLLLLLALGIGGPLTALHQAHLKREADLARSDALEKAEDNRRLAYLGQMNQLGYAAGANGLPAFLKDLLSRWVPAATDVGGDLRCWEWYLFASRINEASHTIVGNGKGISDLSISPDGKRFAACSDQSNILRIWDSESAELRHEFEPHSEGIAGIDWSEDGRLLVSASRDRTVALWNTDTWKLVRRSNSEGAPEWNCVRWGPDESLITAGGADDTVRFLDPKTLAEIGRFRAVFDTGPGRLAWNHEDRLAICGTPAEGNKSILLRQLSRPSVESKVTSGAVICDLAWQPDGTMLVVSSWDQRVRIYDGKQSFSLGGHGGRVWSVAWRPDGRQFATGAEDRELLIWNFQGRQTEVVQELPGHPYPIDRLSWGSEGDLLLAGDRNGGISMWHPQRIRTFRLIYRRPMGIQAIRWGPDGQRIACACRGNALVLVDSTNGAVTQPEYDTWPGEMEPPPGAVGRIWGPIGVFDWSRDGKHLAYRRGKDYFAIIDLDTGKRSNPVRLPDGRLMNMAWDPSGDRLLVATSLPHQLLWDRETGEYIREIKSGELGGRPTMSWSPDGRYVLLSGQNRRQLVFSTQSWELIHKYEESGSLLITDGHAWSPDGNRFATSGGDGTIRFWTLGKSTPDMDAVGHAGYVNAIVWHPNEPRLASGGKDGTIRIWDTDTGQLVTTLSGHDKEVTDVSWSVDGLRLASASADGGLRIWDGTKAYAAHGR